MTGRLVILSAVLLSCVVYRAAAIGPEIVPVRESLYTMPGTLGPWVGHDDPRLSEQILAILGVDDHLTRTYARTGAAPVSLYIGYYQSQRQGDTIHSPMNCLPGAGWQAVSSGRASIAIAGRAGGIDVNRYVIQKGADRQLVLYWYQSHGRVVASEYWSKAYLVFDAARSGRSDAALVRVITPVLAAAGGEAGAERRAVSFVQTLFPHLNPHLPS